MNIAELMTPEPTSCPPSASLADAARIMRDEAIGDVLVCDDGRLVGIVTDRDLVIRGLASGSVDSMSLADVCTGEVTAVEQDADVAQVAQLMQERSLRRVPVVDGERPVGIVSLGDLAAALDEGSVLGQISTAPPDE